MLTGRNPLASVFNPVVREGFLGKQRQALFDFAIDNKSGFMPAQTTKGLVPDYRISSILNSAAFDEWRCQLALVFADAIPAITDELKFPTVPLNDLEIELVCHGDGAFYRRHIDTLTGEGSDRRTRALSLVYYFHGEPKEFTGGELRIFAISSPQTFIDVEPLQDRLVAFPSWAPHEVRPISCPSDRFESSRFAVNCWVRRQR